MSQFSSALQRFAVGHSDIELVYASHHSWPLRLEAYHESVNTGHRSLRPLTISILDSSFNPPTMAHLSLLRISQPLVPGLDEFGSDNDFDATLLLYSIKNADKILKAGDATHLQRLEMISLLAGELEKSPSGNQGSQNVAIAICREPTFVGKSTALRGFLQEHLAPISPRVDPPRIRLSFLLGLDTLERLFAPRYYGSESAMKDALRTFLSSSGDDSRIICARRSTGPSYSQQDTTVVVTAAGFIDSGTVVLVDIEESVQALSSSEVREDIKSSSEGWERKVPFPVAGYIKENGLYGYTVML